MTRQRKILIIWLLVAIFVGSLLIRIVKIDQTPPGLTWDEAALGYNAYSILKTGRDEYGQVLPIIFKSFGDYKPGLYVYLDIPFVALFGLNEFSVRLPSILLGSLIPLIGFLISEQLFARRRLSVSILVAFFLMISPWAINFSRGAWETNVALFESLLGLYLLLKARDGTKKWLIWAVVLFGLSILTYQSAKVFAVLLPLSVVLMERAVFFSQKLKKVTIIMLVLLLSVLALSVADPQIRSRLVVLNQLSYSRDQTQVEKIRAQEINDSSVLFDFYHSSQLEYLTTVSSRFVGYLSPQFLFVQSPPDSRQGALGYGMMHLIELPLLLLGIFMLTKINYKQRAVILVWIFLSILPAALSRDITNTVRSLPLVFGLELLVALGASQLLTLSKRYRLVVGMVVVGCLILNFNSYIDRYFVHSPIHGSEYWIYGEKEAVNYVQSNKQKYNQVIFTTKLNQPYIFYLFYTRYDPASYQKQAFLQTNGVDSGSVTHLDNIEFRPLYWPNDRSLPHNLYVGGWLEIPDQDIDPKQSKLLKVIHFLDGTTAFRIAETL